MGSSRFTWGDAVRVKPEAPAEIRAGECGDIVAITEIDTHDKAENYGAPVGSTVYQVEFRDGEAMELLEAWLEPVTK
jgi:hypothetical protein